MRCFNLPSLDFFSKSDPVVVIYTKAPGEEDKWDHVDQTECIMNNLAPVFAKVVTLDWNVNTELKFEVLDMDDRKHEDIAKAQFIGYYTVSLAELVCIGGATGRKHLHWKNGNVIANGSISVLATLIGGNPAEAIIVAKKFVETQDNTCTLYWSPGAPASLACLAVAQTELAKEDLKLVKVDQVGRELQRMEINPSGVFPFLDDAGFRLNGAGPIIRYLFQKYPGAGTHLYPTDLQGRARVEQALDWHSSHTARGWPFLAPKFGASVEDAAQEEGKRWYDSSLPQLETLLTKQPFLAGSTLTIADIVSFVELALLPPEATANLPSIVRWLQALAVYDSVVAEAKKVVVV